MINTHVTRQPQPDAALLLAGVSSRDEAALGELASRYQRMIFGVALRVTGDHALAEEVVQDTLLAVWRSAHQFEPGRSVAAWLSGLARNRAIDTLRSRSHQARRREHMLVENIAPAAEHTEAVLLRATLLDAMAQLDAAQRALVALAFFGDLSHAEIATHLGLPLGTVKSRMRAALAALRARLGPPDAAHGALGAAPERV